MPFCCIQFRDVLKTCGCRHAYVSCTDTLRPAQFLSSILTQLNGTKRKRTSGYQNQQPCDNMGHFLLKLAGE